MEAPYHRLVLSRALRQHVSARALRAITAANLRQDSLLGLLRAEFHFDNAIAGGLAYVEACRAQAAQAGAPAAAWAAFGRLTHAAQDFYSHSNYVALWLERFPPGAAPGPEAIDGLDRAILAHPRLVAARVYPLEALGLLRPLRPLVRRLLPADSHARMNLDSPAAGPLFPYSIEAAVQRTGAELERTLAAIEAAEGAAARARFCDQ